MLRRRRLLGGIGAGVFLGADPVEACPRDQIQHSFLGTIGGLLFPDAYAACGGETLAIDTIGTQAPLTPFQVSGSIGNMTVAPTLEYRDNNTGSWLPLPAGSSVTSTRFSFSHPGLAGGTSPPGPPPPPPPPAAGAPGAPVVASAGTTSNSITVAYTVPTTGGAQNAGVYQVQYKLSTSGTYLNATTARYTTLNAPSFTDSFGNVYTVVPSAGGQVNALMANGVWTGAWNLGQALLVGNNLYHVNIGGTWYVWSLTGTITGTLNWTSIGTTSPLVTPGIVISGLSTGTYNVQGFATNTTGQGPNSTVINVPVSATAPPPPPPPPGVPAVAAAVGFTRRTAGPNVTLGVNVFRTPGAGGNIVQNGDGTIRIPGGTSPFNDELNTCAGNTGVAFGGGGYFEAVISIAGTVAHSNGWPAYWTNAAESNGNFGLGQLNNNQNLEWDFFEFQRDGDNSEFDSGWHHWYGAGQDYSALTAGESGTCNLPPGTNINQPHKYAGLWVPATSTTQGYITMFFDDIEIIPQRHRYNLYGGGSTPGQANNSPGSIIDLQHCRIMWGTSNVNAFTLHSFSVWQRDDSRNIRVGVALPP